MSKMPVDNPPLKKAFVIAPIKSEGSPERRRLRGLQKAIFEPVFKELNYDCLIPCDESKPGSITDQIITHLYEDDLIVCDLTDLNPNVMFELGVRYTFGKPVVLIAEEKMRGNLPFDILQERVVWYVNDTFGMFEKKEEFKKFVQETEKETTPNNFVRDVIKEFEYKKDIKNDPSKQFQAIILDKFEMLDRKTDNIASAIYHPSIKRDMSIAEAMGLERTHQKGNSLIERFSGKSLRPENYENVQQEMFKLTGDMQEILSFVNTLNRDLSEEGKAFLLDKEDSLSPVLFVEKRASSYPSITILEIVKKCLEKYPSISIAE